MVIDSDYVEDGQAAKKELICMVVVICEEFKFSICRLILAFG